jgi:hypothetical protein
VGAQIVLHNGAQRWPVQVIEVRVRDQDKIDGRQIAHPQAGAAQPFKHEKPARKIGIDEHAASANLHEKTGMTDKRNAEISIAGQARSVRLAAPRGDGGVAHQARKLCRAFAQSRIAKRLFNHPA